MSRSNTLVAAAFVVSFVAQGKTFGESFGIEVPELEGTFIHAQDPIIGPMDFGVEFESIESLTIDVTATGTPGLLEVRDLITGETTESPFNGSITARLVPEESSSLDDSEAFFLFAGSSWGETPETRTSVLIDVLTTTLDSLLDGRSNLWFVSGGFASAPETQVTVLEPAMLDIISVQVTVQGQPVPEPTILSLIAPPIILGSLKRNRSRGRSVLESTSPPPVP